jgi:tetratricopeptide (TPR) repeat protein
MRGDHRTGVSQAELAVSLAERGDISPELAEALTLLTHHRFALGRFHDAMASAERGRASWHALGRTERECEALSMRAAACSEAGFDEEALHDAHQAFELARAAQLPERLLQALSLMGGFHGRLGDVEGAEALLLQALSRAREWHDHSARFLALNNLVSVLVQAHALHRARADTDAARATAERLLHQARYSLTLTAQEPSRLRRAVLRSNAAAGLMSSGLLDEALPLLDDCLAQARSEGFRAVELKARTRLLQCLAQSGAVADAQRTAVELQAMLAHGGPWRHQPPAEQEAAAMLAALDEAVTRHASPAALEEVALEVLSRHCISPPALQAAVQDHLELVLSTLEELDTVDRAWCLRPSPVLAEAVSAG